MTAKTRKLNVCPECEIRRLRIPADEEQPSLSGLQLNEKSRKWECRNGHSMTAAQLATATLALGNLKSVVAEAGRSAEGENASKTGAESLADVVAEHTALTAEIAVKLAEIDADLDRNGDKTGLLEGVERPAGSSPAQDDLRPPASMDPSDFMRELPADLRLLRLQNGDVIVPVIVPECYVGPVEELAGEERKTVSEWLSENLPLYLSQFFVTDRG